MNVLLAAHGSRGDVYPMIALGREFASHGHDVLMYTQPTHACRLERAGLDAIYTAEDMKESMSALGGGLKGIRDMMDWSRRSLEEEFRLLEEISGRADLLVCTNQEFSAASIAEWREIPAFRLSYMPAIPGDHTPPLIPWQDLPVLLNRLIWKGFGAGLDSMCRSTVNDWRLGKGLAPVKSLTPHMTGTFLTLYGFNSTLAPPHTSWNDEVYRYCGYCFEDDDDELPGDLEKFLYAGDPPMYFGFGSVSVPDPDRITRIALEAADRAGCRLVIGRGWTGLGSPEVLAGHPISASADRVFITGDVPHSRLFPRCAGACHHGGSGTVHRALAAGLPQLVMPVFVDQHFWGRRIHQSGAGPRPLPPKKLTPESLAAVFAEFTTGETRGEAVGRLAAAAAADGGTADAYRIIMDRMAGRESGAA